MVCMFVMALFLLILLNKQVLMRDDLSIFWEALKNMFDNDRSAARGLMSAQKLIVFRHDSELGKCPGK